jgi:hypothetical protein
VEKGAMLAWASARVDDPSYPALPRATERLAKLGLPPLSTEGDGPLEIVAGLEAGTVTVRRLRFAVPGLRADARGRATVQGEELRATATVSAQPAWLARSRLLAIPATLAGTIDLRRGLFRPRGPLALPERPLPVPGAPFEAAPDDALALATIVGGALPHESIERLAEAFVSARPKNPHPE